MLDTKDAGPVTVPDTVRTSIEGRLDAVQGSRVYGWAWDRANPDDRLPIEIFVHGPGGQRISIGSAVADRLRDDLATSGDFGDGQHAFDAEVVVPPGVEPSSVFAVARSPRAEAELTLALPSADEQLLERTVAPHLLRIVQAVDASRLEHRQLGRVLKDIQDRLTAPPPAKPDSARLDRLAGDLAETRERMDNLEVFLVRMDTALRNVEASLTAGQTRMSPVAIAAFGAGGGVLLTLAIVLAGHLLA
ncbi:MAG TPA: hypothetical protein VD978_19685 [Azospirillum sp.]|nr:hypothetical protein [Azospirillum sp.]